MMLVIVSMGWSTTVAAPPAKAGKTFTVTMLGENEVNSSGVPNQGDLEGTGTAIITLNPGKETICYDITVDEIGTPTAAHIHAGEAGVANPPFIGLFSNGGPLSGCVSADREDIVAILANPAGYYVNFHNPEFPGGALRGQLG
jgi:hypothetical protein